MLRTRESDGPTRHCSHAVPLALRRCLRLARPVLNSESCGDSCALSLERSMLIRVDKIHPALKHAGYSATTLLPGEDPAEFEKLNRALIDEFAPVGPLEEEIIADMARLTWRKQNLATFRIAELAQRRHAQINREKFPDSDFYFSDDLDPAERKERYRAPKEQAPPE